MATTTLQPRALRLLPALALLAGCGGGARDRVPDGLVPAPRALARACARERIACPTHWPARLDRRRMPAAAVRVMAPGSLLDVANGFCGRRRCRGVFHAVLGQQPGPLPPVDARLRLPMRTHTVPMRGGGRFVDQRAPRRLATVTIAGGRAAVYQAAPYPQGGLHGGHVVVLWNAHGRGRLVSVHAVGLPRREVIRLAVAIARSEPS